VLSARHDIGRGLHGTPIHANAKGEGFHPVLMPFYILLSQGVLSYCYAMAIGHWPSPVGNTAKTVDVCTDVRDSPSMRERPSDYAVSTSRPGRVIVAWRGWVEEEVSACLAGW
jgi:hypothetical protein